VWNLVSHIEERTKTAFEKMLRLIFGSKNKEEWAMEEIS
jgi:hypothetical protein